MASIDDVIVVLRERRARAEAKLRVYAGKVSVARAELDTLEAAIDLFVADAPKPAPESSTPAARERLLEFS